MGSTVDKIEDFLASVEEKFHSSVSAADKAINQLWQDITRYGPNIPAHIPSIELQTTPPPPVIELPTWYEHAQEWVSDNPWTTGGIVVGTVGGSLLVGYGTIYLRAVRARRAKAASAPRRQVVVVLGGDTPFGLPLIHDLEKKGYIVIASVAQPDAAEALESQCHGYVRALVLDPGKPETIPAFLRSLSSALSRRFPINAHGDPFAGPTSHSYIHSIVSLLTLTPPNILAPLEHLSLQDTYLPYLVRAQITPLQVIQSLLPLLRTPAKEKKTIVICLPATETRIGLPFSALQSMATASTLRAVEVLRREIKMAAITGKSEFMKNIKVVSVDVGTFDLGTPPTRYTPEDVYRSMEQWSQSEKLTYGPAFISISHKRSVPAKSTWRALWTHSEEHPYGVPRKPTRITVFVDNIIGVVSNGQVGPSILGIPLGIGIIRNYIRGERFSVGAGAHTYQIASLLPSLILDALLNIPHFLISARQKLLRAKPVTAPSSSVLHVPLVEPHQAQDTDPDSSNISDPGSDADIDSDSGEEPSHAKWIRLNNPPEPVQEE